MADIQKLIEEIEKLSLLEVSQLVKALEEKFGVSASAPVMMAGAAMPGAAAAPAEEKTEFDVVITAVGDKKLEVIKAVRLIKPELGLGEAKTLVEKPAPNTIAQAVKKEAAEDAKAKLTAAGATVELK